MGTQSKTGKVKTRALNFSLLHLRGNLMLGEEGHAPTDSEHPKRNIGISSRVYTMQRKQDRPAHSIQSVKITHFP